MRCVLLVVVLAVFVATGGDVDGAAIVFYVAVAVAMATDGLDVAVALDDVAADVEYRCTRCTYCT